METDLKFPDFEDYPMIEDFDPVEFVRKIRTKLYNEENGFPCDEEIKYIKEARRSFEKQAVEWKRNKSMQFA